MALRTLLLLALSLPALSAQASSLALANARSYYVDFSISAPVEGCEAKLMLELDRQLIRTIPDSSRADAQYRVQIELGKTSGLRKSLSWVADVYSADRQLLFSAGGEESGWTMQAACLDAAGDIAEALGDEVASARVNRADLPLPEYPEKYRPRAGLPEAIEQAPDPDYSIRERPIRPQAPPEHAASHRWQTHAQSFARTRGCSKQLRHVQSLETGTETYATRCGDSGEVLITCAAGECILSF